MCHLCQSEDAPKVKRAEPKRLDQASSAKIRLIAMTENEDDRSKMSDPNASQYLRPMGSTRKETNIPQSNHANPIPDAAWMREAENVKRLCRLPSIVPDDLNASGGYRFPDSTLLKLNRQSRGKV